MTDPDLAAAIGADPAAYLAAVAGGDPYADEKAWQQVDLIPRVLHGRRSVSTGVTLGGTTVATPVVVAATAAHGLFHPGAELETAAGAAAAGALFCYSSSATVEVTRFGAAATGPWWAQVYVMTDRGRTWDYAERSRAAGAGELVLTADNPGEAAFAAFRRTVQPRLANVPGNYPGWTWAEMSASIEPALTPDVIGELADRTGLPVWVKGVLHPGDVDPVIDAGAAGIIVSNHGRRQLEGVIPVARALPAVLDAVAGRVPVQVDGGIRSGTDVLRALSLGAVAAGVGRPVIQSLASGGAAGVTALLGGITAQLRQGLAALGGP